MCGGTFGGQYMNLTKKPKGDLYDFFFNFFFLIIHYNIWVNIFQT